MPDASHVSLYARHAPQVVAAQGPSGPVVRSRFTVGTLDLTPDLARQMAAGLLIAADEADPPTPDLDLQVARTLRMATGGAA